MTKKLNILPALLFLGTFLLGLIKMSGGVGWGVSPELAAGIAVQKKVTLLGHPVLEMLGRFSYAIPFTEKNACVNLLSVLLFSLFIVFIFYAVKELSHSTAGSFAAVAAIYFIPGLPEYFVSLSPGAWTLFLYALILFLGAKALIESSAASIYCFLLAAGIMLLNSGFTAFFILFLLTLIIINNTRKFKEKGFVFSAVAFAALSTIPLTYLVTMDALYVNFESRLPPWLGVLAPASNIASRIMNPGDASEMLHNFIALAHVVSGPYFLFLIGWLAAIVFFNKQFKGKWALMWGLPLPALLFLLFCNIDARSFYLAVFNISLCISGTCCVAVAVQSTAMSIGAKKTAIAAVGIIFLAPVVFFNSHNVKLSASDYSEEFLRELALGMRRDALILIDPGPDHLYGISFMQIANKQRRDISVVYPYYLIKSSYRKYVRASQGAGVVIPSEDDYEKILKQLSAIIPATGGGSSKLLKRRVIEGTVGMIYETMSVQNSIRRSVYFNRIDSLFSSRLYPFMQFAPSSYTFRLNIYGKDPIEFADLLELAKSKLADDPVVRKITAVYFQNIGEHFYTDERYEPAVSVLEAAAGLDPDNISSRFFLGIIYKQWGQYDRAEFNLQQALALLFKKKRDGREQSNDIYMIARIYNELGMREESEKYENMVQPGQAPGSIPGAIQTR